MGKHALLSPSSTDRWMACPGSVNLTKDLPEDYSPYAQEGTNYHELAEVCLTQNKDASEFVGQPFEDETTVDEDNAEYVQVYIDLVRELQAQGGLLKVEEKVPLAGLTGEVGGEGTCDCVIIRDTELVIIDLKFGRGVAVKADGNKQMQSYAVGVLDKNQLWDEIKTIRMIICQPRVMDGTSEWTISIEELKHFRDEIQVVARPILKAIQTGEKLPLHPTEKGCRFCRAKADCLALQQQVEAAMDEGFEDLTQPKEIPVISNPGYFTEISAADRLGEAMKKAELAEIWIKGVRAKVEAELFANRPVTGQKLVQGKKGNRKWIDEKKAEETMKGWRIKSDDMYSKKLISPTKADKFFKANPLKWKKLLEMITQSEGSISVAPTEDPRPAYVVEAQDAGFESVDGSEAHVSASGPVQEDFSDLF